MDFPIETFAALGAGGFFATLVFGYAIYRMRFEVERRKTAELEAKKVRQELERLTDNIPGSVFHARITTENDFEYVYVSRGIERTGYTAEEIVHGDAGLQIGAIEEDKPIIDGAVAKAIADRGPIRAEYRVKLMDGDIHWIRSVADPYEDEDGSLNYYGYHIGVTMEKELERQANESKAAAEQARQRIEEITDTMPGAVYEVAMEPNGQWQFQFISNAMPALIGTTRQALFENPVALFDSIHPGDKAKLGQEIAEYQLDQEVEHLFRVLPNGDEEGDVRWISTRAMRQQASSGEVVRGVMTDVTERVRIEQELRKTEEDATRSASRLREMADNILGSFWRGEVDVTDPADPKIKYTDFLGQTSDLFYPMRVEDALADFKEFFKFIHPDDLPRLQQDIADGIRQGHFHSEYRTTRKSGNWGWVKALGSVYPTEKPGILHAVGFATDIDEEKRLQDELEKTLEAAETARRMVENMSNNVPGVILEMYGKSNGKGAASFVSEGVEELVGVSREAVLDDMTHYFSRVHPQDLPELMKTMMSAIQTQQAFRSEYRVKHAKTGETRWLLVQSAAPSIREDGTVIAHSYTFDITDLKSLEANLAQARDEAQQAEQAKGDFLANMSHEIRTPMNAILGMTHLVQQTDLSQKQANYLKKIDQSAHALLRIINDILDFSKIEAGKIDVENIDFNLDEVLENLASLMGVRAQDKNLELAIKSDSGVPRTLVGDPLRLGQVLINLAGNAIKFTDDGMVTVEVNLLQLVGDQVVLKFEVSDSGIGLSEEQMGSVFESFSQADTSTSRKFGGTGLGLAISKNLVELMGGEIGVTSVEGQGSEFWFEVPFGISEQQAPATEAEQEFRKRRVLIVDDNEIARDVLTEMVQGFGSSYEVAVDSDSALARLERGVRQNQPYDLVLMDWKMPGRTGNETTRMIRQEPDKFGRPKIVTVTAYGREDVMKDSEESGADGFLIKPVGPSVLLDTVNTLFGKDEALVRASRPETQDKPNFSGMRVLLVEDNAINQEVASEILSSVGIAVDVAENGQEAVDIVTADSQRVQPYDLVFMDCQMPVLDGFAATRKIREHPGLDDLPIVAMTANAMAGDRERCIEAGMQDYVTKPIDLDQLYKAIKRFAPGGASQNDGQEIDQKVEQGALTNHSPPSSDSTPEASNTNHSDWPDLPGINVEGALARVGGNQKLLHKLLLRFRADRNFEAVKTHWGEGEHEAASRCAHSLKGMAANIGITAVIEPAATVESELHDGVWNEVSYAALGDAVAQARHTLAVLQDATQDSAAHAQGESDGRSAQASVAPVEQFEKILNELSALLDDDDTAAIECVEELALALREAPGNSTGDAVMQLLKSISDAINGYDFGTARELGLQLSNEIKKFDGAAS